MFPTTSFASGLKFQNRGLFMQFFQKKRSGFHHLKAAIHGEWELLLGSFALGILMGIVTTYYSHKLDTNLAISLKNMKDRFFDDFTSHHKTQESSANQDKSAWQAGEGVHTAERSSFDINEHPQS